METKIVEIERYGELVTYEITGNLSIEGLLKMFEAWDRMELEQST